ncbi:MAG TPA: metallophosphoesterase [Actinomycetota bacterium]|nr:metallophosphoesterase [Actinomycetota bacterium]
MAIKVVSDLHSAVDALAREVHEDDTLLLLGDLINIIDYGAMDGILVDVFGADTVTEVVGLRAQRRFDDARAVMQRIRHGREAEVAAKFQALIREGYRQVREALPHRAYVILGNVDSPPLAGELERPGVEMVDGRVVEIEGLRVGFLGGGLPTPLRVSGEIPEEEFDAKVDALGQVDVVCSHVPPDLPELTYDTVARRRERGSARLLEYVREVQPLRVFFGHIHQPLLSSTHLGRTHLINAGYFRRTQRALPLAL